MDPSALSAVAGSQQNTVELPIGNVDARVIDQSHDNTYNAENIYTGAQITIISQNASSTPVKEELPLLPRCPAPCTGYVRRKALENHLSSYFFGPSHDDDRRRRLVLHGLGGSGKTQGALHFIDQNFYSQKPGEERFSEAYWVDATTTETITKSLEDIALLAGLSKAEDALALLAGHNSKSNWIMLYNNADDPSLDLAKYFPKCTHGNIIITTRNRQAARYGLGPGSDYTVAEMEHDEAQALFMNQARLFNTTPATMQAVDQLIEELNHFPLSVRQSGAYIFATSCTPAEYLDKFRSRRKQLLRKHDEMNAEDYQYGTVQATLSLSLARLSPEALRLLQLFACLHREYILEKIFRDGFSGLRLYKRKYRRLATKAEKSAIANMNDILQNLITSGRWDVDKFRALLTELKSLSLVTPAAEEQTYSIHPLVREQTRSTMDKAIQTLFWQGTTLLLGSAVGQNQAQTEPSFLRAIAPHVDEVLKQKMGILYGCENGFGHVYKAVGRWSDEMALRERYDEVCQKILGRQHIKTLTAMNDLAEVHRSQGSHEKAAKMHFEVFTVRKVKLGVDHSDTLTSMSNLAETYRDQGHYDKAAEMQSEVFRIRKAKWGADHLDTLTAMANLASTYRDQGHYDKAAEMQSEVFEVRKVKLGADHMDTLESMNNLALTYWHQGHYDKAAEMQLEVVEIGKVKLGVDHPDTLTAMNNLAMTYGYQGHYDKASEIQLELYKTHKTKLGVGHPSTIRSMHNLALTYQGQGHYEKAVGLQTEVLAICKVELDVDHPTTLISMSTLALTYQKQGHYEKAAEMQSEVFEIRKAKLGMSHPSTIVSMHNLALTYRYQGHYEKAAEMLSDVFNINKVKLGVDHPDTLRSMYNLALTYRSQCHYEKAAEMLSEVFEANKVKLGVDHPSTLASMNNLALTYQDLEDLTKAAELYSQLIELQRARLGADHSDTQKSVHNLQSILQRQRESVAPFYLSSGDLATEDSNAPEPTSSPGHIPQSPPAALRPVTQTQTPEAPTQLAGCNICRICQSTSNYWQPIHSIRPLGLCFLYTLFLPIFIALYPAPPCTL